VKAPASLSQANSNRDAPMSEFIVSDDDVVNESDDSDDSDGDIEHHDYASPLQMIRSISDKENRPISKVTEDSGKWSQRPKRAVNSNSDTTLAGSIFFLEPNHI